MFGGISKSSHVIFMKYLLSEVNSIKKDGMNNESQVNSPNPQHIYQRYQKLSEKVQ